MKLKKTLKLSTDNGVITVTVEGNFNGKMLTGDEQKHTHSVLVDKILRVMPEVPYSHEYLHSVKVS